VPSVITLPSGASFQPKRLTVRALKEAVVIVETIRVTTKQSEMLELVEKALTLTIESDQPIIDLVDLPEAMQLIGQAISGGRVTDDERKKSELPH
jgi:hypothetical protein